VTNSRSSAETPTAPPELTEPKAAKPRRTGARRFSSPAGAPQTSGPRAPALLVVGVDGLLLAPEEDLPQAPLPAPDDAGTDSSADAGAKEPLPARAETDDSPEADAADVVDDAEVVDGAQDSDAGATEMTADSAPVADLEPALADEAVPADEPPTGQVDVESPVVPDAAPVDDADSAKVGTAATDTEDVPDAPEASVVASEATEATEATEASEDNAAGEPTEDAAPADAAAPLSRRERRLAEQSGPDGATPATSAAPARKADAPSAPLAPTPSETCKPRRKLWSALRGFLLFVVIAAVVVGMGTVISGKEAPTEAASATEGNRTEAWARSAALLGQAKALAANPANASLKTLLASTATALDAQVSALAGDLPTATATTTSTAVVTPATFSASLEAGANELLADSLTAEGALGRTFASVGTSWLLQSAAINKNLGKSAPQSAFLATATFLGPAAMPSCHTTRKPEPGLSSDAALATAAQAEQKAVYAYQVAGTRLPEPAFTRAVNLLAAHEARLARLNGELAAQCLPQLPLSPGFMLEPSFTSEPAKSLAALEGQLVLVYGDLAALSQPAPATLTSEKGAAHATAGATATAAAGAPKPGSQTSVRAISIAWLLGSAMNQLSWGGTVGALPGIPAPAMNGATATATP
jgi:Domain of unknown function (DUF4439)